MRLNRKTTKKLYAAGVFELQGLESRTMLTAVPLGVKFSRGLLTVTGTTGNDQITITHVGTDWTISNGAEWSMDKIAAVTKVNVNGKAGNDTITLDSTVTIPATLLGDLGDDAITIADGASSISGGAGNDSLTAGSANATLSGDAGDDTLVGGSGADKLFGGAGNDSISGNAGNDSVQGGLGNDVMSGGDGTDTIDYNDHTALQGVTMDIGAGTAGMSGESDTFTADFERFSMSQGADSVTGSSGDDIIAGNGGNDTINGLAGNDKIYDGAGNDSVSGGDGDDSLYSNAGADSLDGGNGDDQIIAVGGGAADSVTGGSGSDTFWVDNSVTETVSDADSTEIANGAVHKVGALMKGVSKELSSQKLGDPVASKSYKYRNFSDHPLFASDGPSIDDIAQGQVGDCYFLATLASIAKIDPERIRQSVVDFGDGTFGVRFFKGSVATYVRVDGDLPTYAPTTPAYVKFGAEGSMWAPIIEKAFTYFRKGSGTYSSISSGLMGEVFSDFGVSVTSLSNNNSADATTFVQKIKDLVDAGQSVTAACYQTGGANMITSHAYTVVSVDDSGNVTVRNPWGMDGYSSTDGADDGYVTLTPAQAFIALGYVQAASV
jgi:hypothetical protein